MYMVPSEHCTVDEECSVRHGYSLSPPLSRTLFRLQGTFAKLSHHLFPGAERARDFWGFGAACRSGHSM